MARGTVRRMLVVAGAAWAAVAVTGIIGVATADDNWEVWYLAFTLALVVGVATTARVVATLTEDAVRPGLRRAGLAVVALAGVASVIVAWALPLWMGLLGLGFGLVAAATPPSRRRPVALLAGGQLAGIVVLIAGIEAQVGRRDEWGDYPMAGGIALGVVAVATVVALASLNAAPRGAIAPTPAGV